MTFSQFIVHFFTDENGHVKLTFHTSQFAISHFTFLDGQPLAKFNVENATFQK